LSASQLAIARGDADKSELTHTAIYVVEHRWRAVCFPLRGLDREALPRSGPPDRAPELRRTAWARVK
jgi:hypothetical protein